MLLRRVECRCLKTPTRQATGDRGRGGEGGTWLAGPTPMTLRGGSSTTTVFGDLPTLVTYRLSLLRALYQRKRIIKGALHYLVLGVSLPEHSPESSISNSPFPTLLERSCNIGHTTASWRPSQTSIAARSRDRHIRCLTLSISSQAQQTQDSQHFCCHFLLPFASSWRNRPLTSTRHSEVDTYQHCQIYLLQRLNPHNIRYVCSASGEEIHVNQEFRAPRATEASRYQQVLTASSPWLPAVSSLINRT